MRDKFLKEVSNALLELTLKALRTDEKRLIDELTRVASNASKPENIEVE